MYLLISCILTLFLCSKVIPEYIIYENDMNFRIDPGSRTCFFEQGKIGQVMEAHYEVLDGQHGDLDISFDIIDPNGVKILSDYKKLRNTFVMELEHDGDYLFCMDNTYSIMNSKLVFVNVLMENKNMNEEQAITIAADRKDEEQMEEILQWMGVDEEGETYYIDISYIADSLMRILKFIVQGRHQLDRYGAMKSRDSYIAFEDTFIVDMWSGFQICFMLVVGMIQVYMIKKLFKNSYNTN